MSDPSVFVSIKNATFNLHPPVQSQSYGGFIKLDLGDIVGKKEPEYRELGGGEEITVNQLEAELAELGDEWRLETPHELFALVDYSTKNANGAYSSDTTIKKNWYWTSQDSPTFSGARVVVGFVDGFVYGSIAGYRAIARAVRVARQ